MIIVTSSVTVSRMKGVRVSRTDCFISRTHTGFGVAIA